ncbi:hypothetical protein [Flavobacterium salmonis]|nr:hypothetical protein [Flavobacterium salmonis]
MNRKISFTKKTVFVNPLYSFHNRMNYNIIDENSIKSTLMIMSTLTGELQTEGKTYHIKPISKFFTVKGFEILLESNKIGSIEYWGWIWKKPKLIINIQGDDQVWIFEKNEPGLFRKRTNPYITKMKYQGREVEYKIESDNSTSEKESLRRLSGTASFKEEDRLPCQLGIYLNELLIFDEMDK